MPENFIEMFSSIVDKFSNVVENLISGTKRPQDTAPSGGGSGGAPPGAPPPPGGGMMTGPGVEGLADFIAGAESGGRFDAYAGDSGKGNPDIPKMTLSQLQQKYGDWNTAVGAYQFMPGTAIGLAKKMGLDPNTTVFTPEIQKQLNVFHLNEMGYKDYVSGKISKEEFGKRISQQYRALPVPGTDATYQDKYAKDNRALRTDAQFLQALEKSKQSSGIVTTPGIGIDMQKDESQSRVSPAPAKPQAMQATSQAISQPAQQTPSLVSLPPTVINASAPEQSSGSGSPPPPPPASGSSIEVPFLTTSNPNNFYVLYARSVYNVVDG